LYIAAVLHARCLLTVVSQVPIINFCEHFMSIISIIMSAYSLRMQLFFDLLYLVVKLVPFLVCLQGGLIRFRSALLYHLEPPMQHQHLSCVEGGSSLISISSTFCGHISSIFFSSLQFLRCSDTGGTVIPLDYSSKFT
jgi:hypothetical protein